MTGSEQTGSELTGAELRRARKARNIGTQMLADLIGVHRNTITRWERGDEIPGPAQVSLQWVLSLSNPKDVVPRRRVPSKQKATVAR